MILDGALAWPTVGTWMLLVLMCTDRYAKRVRIMVRLLPRHE